MNISSSAFENNTKIPTKYTCDGENINPPLSILDVPQDAKSLVLIVDDPDAPSKIASNAAGAWVHWTVFNIDPTISEVPENSVPKAGLEGMTDFGSTGYGGPCPPSGIHRYVFKLYALDIAFDLSSVVDKKTIEEKMQGRVLEKAELIGLYERR